MKNANYILEELNIISPLIGQIEKQETYSVPSDYFNDLSLEVLNRIYTDKLRACLSKASSLFQVPANYFENLPDLVLQNIFNNHKEHDEVFEELQQISPLLNTINKKPVFHTPSNYFDKISVPAAPRPQKAKVLFTNKRLKLARYAAAAVIIPFVAIGLYTITTNEFKSSRSNHSNARNAIKHLSKEEIINFLKNDASTENTTSTSQNASRNDNTIKSSLKQVSDKEIQQFLKETGESDEI